MGLDPEVVRRYLDAGAAGSTADAQGKAYEALAVHLFEAIPGCFAERDIISFFGAEQIDIAVGNRRLPDGLPLLPAVLLVECKDWARPVDTKTVGYFINILANRSVEAGILIAANGITGDREELSRAHALGVSANGLALGRFSVIYATPPCVITSRSPVQGHALHRNSCA